ncbi:hypothetical protein EDD11_005559 [Mortierella claussenii]|nr:hypothetical protein EDD11_005559 [Mortierella claussenii]
MPCMLTTLVETTKLVPTTTKKLTKNQKKKIKATRRRRQAMALHAAKLKLAASAGPVAQKSTILHMTEKAARQMLEFQSAMTEQWNTRRPELVMQATDDPQFLVQVSNAVAERLAKAYQERQLAVSEKAKVMGGLKCTMLEMVSDLATMTLASIARSLNVPVALTLLSKNEARSPSVKEMTKNLFKRLGTKGALSITVTAKKRRNVSISTEEAALSAYEKGTLLAREVASMGKQDLRSLADAPSHLIQRVYTGKTGTNPCLKSILRDSPSVSRSLQDRASSSSTYRFETCGGVQIDYDDSWMFQDIPRMKKQRRPDAGDRVAAVTWGTKKTKFFSMNEICRPIKMAADAAQGFAVSSSQELKRKTQDVDLVQCVKRQRSDATE